ncbi:MAG: 1,2-phenylacetyl-CoA epoxidase subunit PaaC, partial [Steroidobacteraceae bacterium]
KETDYHWRFSSRWLVRLGDGTEESHARVQASLSELWPYTNEFFDSDATDRAMCEVGVAPGLVSLEQRWRPAVLGIIAEATLKIPAERGKVTAGKRGLHGEGLGYLLADMQFLQRAYPGAQW